MDKTSWLILGGVALFYISYLIYPPFTVAIGVLYGIGMIIDWAKHG